jgi:hypothetical protein
LNVHFHCVIPDGVFVRKDDSIRFEPLSPPSDEEVKSILLRIAKRVRKLLKPVREAAQSDARPPDAMMAAQADSVTALLGKPPDASVKKKQTAWFEGFSLHAAVHLHANDRQGLAHLCGYGARPALSQERLSALPDGRLAIRMKRPLADGRESLVLEPIELLRRLATLVPPPRAHLVRFHGVFGPASKWRAEIVPAPPAPQLCTVKQGAPPDLLDRPEDEQTLNERKSRPRDARIPWAELLQRVFREDVLACPCGGRRKVVAFVIERKAVKSILEHLGLPTTAPPIARARSSPHAAVDSWQDDVPEIQQSLR